MRLIKLSKQEFEQGRDVEYFFGPDLRVQGQSEPPLAHCTPSGKFYFGRQIQSRSLDAGETLLFTYDGTLRHIARLESGTHSSELDSPSYRANYFVINMRSLRSTRQMRISRLQQLLNDRLNLELTLAGQGWNILPDTEDCEQIVWSLVSNDLENIVADDLEAEDVEHGTGFREGGRQAVLVNKYARDPRTRARALRIHGLKCKACGLDFGKVYGSHGQGHNTGKGVRRKSKSPRRSSRRPECAGCYYTRGKYAEAEPLYKRSLEIMPDAAAIRLQLGNCYTQQGKTAEAELLLKRARSIQPNATR
jgi:tetratricopeptide (TPR) repeat protein